jgi:hypothetical protein
MKQLSVVVYPSISLIQTRYVPVRCSGTQIDEPAMAQGPGDRRREYIGDDKIYD